MKNEEKNARWSNYWKQGHITSFGVATTDNYSAGVKTFWFRQFESLDSGSVVLDVAAGNGAVAIMAIEYSETFAKNFTVLAADAAEINKDIVEESQSLIKYRDKIQFYSSTPCENLPFDDASVDLVCSQFGIEYSDLQESIPEICRVLRDDGKFAAVMHHYLSVTVLSTLKDQSMLKEAVYEYKIFNILKQYYTDIGDTNNLESIRLARQKPEIINLEKKLLNAFTSLRKKYPNNEIVDALWKNINNCANKYMSKPQEIRLAELEKLLLNYQRMINRQGDLQDAAMSKVAMIKLQKLATESGFKNFSYEKNVNASYQVGGWNINANK